MYMQLPPDLRRLKAKAFLVNVVINTGLYRCILMSRNSTFTSCFLIVVVVVVESPMLTYTLL
jgi:hypothetical protein